MQDAINDSKDFINMQLKIRSGCEQSRWKESFSEMISSQEGAQVSSQFSLISGYRNVNVFCWFRVKSIKVAIHFLTWAPSSVHDKNNFKSKFKASSLGHLGVEVLAYFQCQKEKKHIRDYILLTFSKSNFKLHSWEPTPPFNLCST